jgi:uncharacterized membrane protein
VPGARARDTRCRECRVSRRGGMMIRALLAVHVAGGATALLSMLLPLLARKGGATHRRAGWLFVSGMTVVSVTAFILAAARVLFDQRPAARAGGVFLFYIAILTAAGVSSGMRALRTKRRTAAHRQPWDIGMAAALTVSGVLMAAYGLFTGMPLFVVLAALGIFNGIGQLRYWLRPPASPMHWWYEHMSGMLGSCIAALTAFAVNNAVRLHLPNTSLILWAGPGIIGGTGAALWVRYYRHKFAPTTRRRRVATMAVDVSA